MTAKKLLQIISTILVALVVLLAVALVGVRLAGIRTFTVLSGSMEPTYHVGSLIYVKKVDPTTIRPGQVITFMLDENTVATHRVVEVVPDEDDPSTLRFRTKGDANDAEDGSLVHYKNVIGTPVFTIPKLGYAANYIQHPPGLYVAISAGAVLLLLTFLPGLLSGVILTFIPSMGLFFIADILGGNKIVLVGSLIQDQLTRGSNWPFAAALAVILTILTSLMIFFYRKITHVKDLEGLF